MECRKDDESAMAAIDYHTQLSHVNLLSPSMIAASTEDDHAATHSVVDVLYIRAGD